MVATDAYYDEPERTYLSCEFCDGGGCCVCDYFGVMHKGHPMFGAKLVNPAVTDQQATEQEGEI